MSRASKGNNDMRSIDPTVDEIREKLALADAQELAVLERSLVADSRKGVRSALESARRRIEKAEAERARLAGLYSFEREIVSSKCAREEAFALGLDEVGRGPLAGPLTVGAVVLPSEPSIEGLNDSKQVKPADRKRIAAEVKERAHAWCVQFIEPHDIDVMGMTAALTTAFQRAVASIETAGVHPDVVLLDGNPLHMDKREVNVVKGDGKCASIAAASIVAKVERDELMCRLASEYPEYGFESNKGYASKEHIEAIKKYGLTPVHRVSFCTAFTQPTLF